MASVDQTSGLGGQIIRNSFMIENDLSPNIFNFFTSAGFRDRKFKIMIPEIKNLIIYLLTFLRSCLKFQPDLSCSSRHLGLLGFERGAQTASRLLASLEMKPLGHQSLL